ncbi:MAG: hypothetical protein QOI24_2282 [Acidobacteriota bacterium]|jgi:hypothetical protein|nr:hypothetical protein [Acidobacteriota bacterium]
MTKLHLLGVAKVRRSLMLPIIVFTVLNAATHARGFDGEWWWMVPAYVLFDSLLWTGVAFLIFAVVEWREKLRPQPRFAAMVVATAGIATLAAAIITVRALFDSIIHQQPFVRRWLRYLPAGFYGAAFYVAIVTGIAYGVYSWAVDDRRLAAAAELDAAIARAELKAASARLQPESLDAALARISTLIATDVAGAQRLISNLGAQLHDSLADPRSSPVASGTTARDSRRRPARAPARRSG